MTKGLILGVLLVVGVGVGAGVWAYTALNEAGADAQRVRWVNVTITIAADSDVYYARLPSAPQGMARGLMGPMLELGTRGAGSLVIVDATTGKVVHDDVLPAERAAFDAVLATLEVTTTDVAAEPGGPWPYGSELPDTPRPRWGNISWVDPDPASGISVQPMMGDSIEPQPPGSHLAISVSNGRSHIGIDGAGAVFTTGAGELTLAEFIQADASTLEGIHPDDREAFQRFAQAVELGPPPEEEEP